MGCPRPGWRESLPPGRLCRYGWPTRGRRRPLRDFSFVQEVHDLAPHRCCAASGSVITDAFGPYEVFARSQEFFVYTVSASRPTAMLSGGLAVVPDYSLEDVDAGLAPEPEVVVVPAVAAPNGKKEAPLREWITRRTDSMASLTSATVSASLLPACSLRPLWKSRAICSM